MYLSCCVECSLMHSNQMWVLDRYINPVMLLTFITYGTVIQLILHLKFVKLQHHTCTGHVYKLSTVTSEQSQILILTITYSRRIISIQWVSNSIWCSTQLVLLCDVNYKYCLNFVRDWLWSILTGQQGLLLIPVFTITVITLF